MSMKSETFDALAQRVHEITGLSVAQSGRLVAGNLLYLTDRPVVAFVDQEIPADIATKLIDIVTQSQNDNFGQPL